MDLDATVNLAEGITARMGEVEEAMEAMEGILMEVEDIGQGEEDDDDHDYEIPMVDITAMEEEEENEEENGTEEVTEEDDGEPQLLSSPTPPVT